MNTAFNIKRYVSFVGAALLFISLFGFVVAVIYRNYTGIVKTEMDQGWTVTINGESRENVDLSRYTFDRIIKKGDVIELRNIVPSDIGINSTLQILVYLTTVDVYVDGKSIYSYGNEAYDIGRFVGSGYHFVYLPHDSMGKEIKVVLKPAESAAFTSIPPFVITPSDYTYTAFMASNVSGMFAGSFLIVFGSVLSLVGIIARLKNVIYERLIYIGLFSLLIGIWTLCSTKVIELFSRDLSLNSFMEYFTLYIALVPMLVLVQKMGVGDSKWKKMSLNGVTVATVSFSFIAWFLHFFNVVHISSFITMFHIIAVLSVLIAFAVGLKPFTNMRRDELILNIGLFELLAFAIVDVVRFNLQKYVFPDSLILSHSVLPEGTVIFIIILMCSYLAYIYSLVMYRAEREMLTKMAYQDPMTGLYNRAKCEEIFKKFNEDESAQCTVFSFDLNGLKKVNDTYGHEAGDELIRKFSKILTDSFSENWTVVRMGGDEFLVIQLRTKSDRTISKYTDRINQKMEEESKSSEYPIHCSYGVAFSNEVAEHNAEKIYKLADERMYEMKVATKSQRTD